MTRKLAVEGLHDKLRAQRLIASGKVTTWVELGRVFGISPQAASSRFGKRGYGLVLPTRVAKFHRMLSVSLDAEEDAALEVVAERLGISRAEVLRRALRTHLGLGTE